jgi:hypothetical protein
MLFYVACLAIVLASAIGAACERSTCTDVPALTRTIDLGARDAGPDAATGSRPLDECRTLCGDTNDQIEPHVTACRLAIVDAGDFVVSCDETAYRLCSPDD